MRKKYKTVPTSFSCMMVFWNLYLVCQSYNYLYTRVNQCVLQTSLGCVQWQTNLSFQKKLDASCFPEETYLQGRENKIKMSELKVGDQVLVYKQNGVGFQKVLAWLHRQTNQQFQYRFINYQIEEKTTRNNSILTQFGIYISGMHNIALLNGKQDNLNYQFAQNIEIGDYLYGHGPYFRSETPKVIDIKQKINKKGVYAPYTQSGNYFITSQINNQQLILVHSFAHVSTKYHWMFDFLINLYPSWNIQPKQTSYIHPLSSYLKDLFPSVLQIKVLNHMARQLSQQHKLYRNWADSEDYEFRSRTHGTQRRDFKQQRKIMVLIDKVFSTAQIFG